MTAEETPLLNKNRFPSCVLERLPSKEAVGDFIGPICELIGLILWMLYMVSIPIFTLVGAVSGAMQGDSLFERAGVAFMGGCVGLMIGFASPVVVPALVIAHFFSK